MTSNDLVLTIIILVTILLCKWSDHVNGKMHRRTGRINWIAVDKEIREAHDLRNAREIFKNPHYNFPPGTREFWCLGCGRYFRMLDGSRPTCPVCGSTNEKLEEQ